MSKTLPLILVMFLSACFSGSSNDELAQVTNSDGTLALEKANYKVSFSKSALREEKYMVFGIQSGNKNMMGFTDGFIAPLPLDRANSLLQQYPRLNYCGDEGSFVVQKEALTFVIVGSSEAVKSQLEQAVQANNEAKKNQGKRICLLIKSHPLTVQNMTYRDMNTTVVSNVPESYVYPKEIKMISCDVL